MPKKIFKTTFSKNKEKYVQIYFDETQKSDDEYYRTRTPEQRLSDIQFCREQYYLLNNSKIKNENRKRLQRVFKIVKQV